MDFTGKVFLAFLAPVLALHALSCWRRFPTRWSNVLIAVSSLALYALWYPPACVLLAFDTLVLWAFGEFRRSRFYPAWGLALGIAPPLGLLFVFKYYDFFYELFWEREGPLRLALPVGISFYTFTVVGYLVDLHRRASPRRLSLADATILVGFWPHLAAGPILRSRDILRNVRRRLPLTRERALLAFLLIFGGAAKKMLVADNLGAYVNANLGRGIDAMRGPEALSTLLGFAGQIYVDFSAYSEMAIGFALLLGFRLPANFAHPYRALSLGEFWHRWHISLSQWFRDYIYIPLGGSRKGYVRGLVHLWIVFLLSGLWHGAGMNFVVWGAIHGSALVLERLVGQRRERLPVAVRWAFTFAVVVLAWSFFRLDISEACLLLRKIFSWDGYREFSLDSAFYHLPIWFFLLLIVAEHLFPHYEVTASGAVALPGTGRCEPRQARRATAQVSAVFCLSLLFSGSPLPFIYFNF